MKILPIVLAASLAACSGSKSNPAGGDAPHNADAKVYLDAPPHVPAMITLSGTAYDSGQTSSTPLAGVAISLKKRSDDSTIASATSDAQGKYSLSVTTGGLVVDAYILATKSGYTDAASFPAVPFAADNAKADSNLVTTSNFGLLGLYTGQQSGKGIVVVAVLDASGTPVSGAAITSTPAAGSHLYSDSNGRPASGSGTNTDGAAFLVNLPPGNVSINVTKSGASFNGHDISAKADTFTSTVVTE